MSNLMEDANAQVRRLVQRVLGLPAGYMRPSKERADASRQNVPFGTVLIMDPTNAGWTAQRYEDDGSGGLNEVLEVPVRFTASVQFFKAAPTPADLRGAQVTDDVTAYHGVTSGGFDVVIDGTVRKVSGLNFSAAVTMADVNAALQARLTAALAGATAAWTGKRFVIGSPTTGQSSAVGTAVAPTSAGPPADVSTLLGLTAAAGASPSDNKAGIAKPAWDAVELARRLPALLESDAHGAYMQSVGLGYLTCGPARDLSGIDDTAWESRGSIDLIFNVIAREVIPVAAIEPPFTAGIKVLEPGGAIIESTISETPPT